MPHGGDDLIHHGGARLGGSGGLGSQLMSLLGIVGIQAYGTG